ncbi:MAG: MBL fold metallo-hydrolase [Candidatus Methanofastidiosia archaeon]
MTKKAKDIVVLEKWYKKLPRKAYEKFEKIDIADDWFEVYKLPNYVYAIYEPRHFQEVISFLIIGPDRSVLLDTGLGIGDVKRVVCQLTSNEVIVINSHIHFDHVGGNHEFSSVYVYDDEMAVERLKRGYSRKELEIHISERMIYMGYPKDFNPESYVIYPSKPKLLHHGDVVNLGNRELEVIHTPGHSKESIMLLDRKNRSLFTGDTFYPGPLYSHFEGDFYGDSNFKTYMKTIDNLLVLIQNLDYLYCSHNEPIASPSILKDVALAFKAIDNKSIDYLDDEGLRKYDFNGFSIITKNNLK